MEEEVFALLLERMEFQQKAITGDERVGVRGGKKAFQMEGMA